MKIELSDTQKLTNLTQCSGDWDKPITINGRVLIITGRSRHGTYGAFFGTFDGKGIVLKKEDKEEAQNHIQAVKLEVAPNIIYRVDDFFIMEKVDEIGDSLHHTKLNAHQKIINWFKALKKLTDANINFEDINPNNILHKNNKPMFIDLHPTGNTLFWNSCLEFETEGLNKMEGYNSLARTMINHRLRSELNSIERELQSKIPKMLEAISCSIRKDIKYLINNPL